MCGAHRVVCALVSGPLPAGCDVAHSCDRTFCVRPSHLHVATRAKNMAEAWERGRFPDNGRGTSVAARRQIPGIVYRRLAATGGNRFAAFKWVADIFGLTPGYVGELYDRARRTAFDAAFPNAEDTASTQTEPVGV